MLFSFLIEINKENELCVLSQCLIKFLKYIFRKNNVPRVAVCVYVKPAKNNAFSMKHSFSEDAGKSTIDTI